MGTMGCMPLGRQSPATVASPRDLARSVAAPTASRMLRTRDGYDSLGMDNVSVPRASHAALTAAASVNARSDTSGGRST